MLDRPRSLPFAQGGPRSDHTAFVANEDSPVCEWVDFQASLRGIYRRCQGQADTEPARVGRQRTGGGLRFLQDSFCFLSSRPEPQGVVR